MARTDATAEVLTAVANSQAEGNLVRRLEISLSRREDRPATATRATPACETFNSYRSTGLPAGTVVIICIVVFGSRAANVAVCDINGPLFDGLTGVYAWGAQSCAVPGVDLPPSPKSPSVGRLSAHHRG